MAREAKKYASITQSDLSLYCAQLLTEHNLLIDCTIELYLPTSSLPRATVRIYEATRALTGDAPIKTACGPLGKSAEMWPGNIMGLLTNAMVQYMNDAWNWTRRDRIREMQAQSGAQE